MRHADCSGLGARVSGEEGVCGSPKRVSSMDSALVRPYRLVALDLDGTLLNDDGQISPEDAAALRRFAQSGGTVVLASGRMTENIWPFYDALGIEGPTIAYNGAMLRNPRPEGGEPILHLPLPARYADALIDYAQQEHLQLNYYLDERLYARDDPALRAYTDLYARQTGAVFHFVPDLERFRGCEPTKALIVADPPVRDALYQEWQARWGAEVTVVRTNPEYLEFLHKEAGKGLALEALARHYGIPQSLTLAFGDSFNDISMLEWAGCGVAVANAHPEVKAAADWVSPRSNNESAVGEELKRLSL